MRAFSGALLLGLLAGIWAQVLPVVRRPECDSLEAEEAALLSQDYINAHHAHGYKYALNQVDDIKVIKTLDGSEIYHLEVDLLETKCHVTDPRPVANCTVRPKYETKVEADCDVALLKAGGVLSVHAYKCKSKPDSTEDLCAGCPRMLLLNHTEALQVVTTTLNAFNNKSADADFALLEVGRLSSQVIGGGPKYFTEYAIVETDCTGDNADTCGPLNDTVARKGFCQATGSHYGIEVDCTVYDAPVPGPSAAVHQHHHHHGFKHHKLTALHDPAASGLLSESKESGEVLAAKPVVKRETIGAPAQPAVLLPPALPKVCPGKIRHF